MKKNKLFEECLSKADPEVKAEVYRRIDLINSLTWEDIREIAHIAQSLGEEYIGVADYEVTHRSELNSEEDFYREVRRQFVDRLKGEHFEEMCQRADETIKLLDSIPKVLK